VYSYHEKVGENTTLGDVALYLMDRRQNCTARRERRGSGAQQEFRLDLSRHCNYNTSTISSNSEINYDRCLLDTRCFETMSCVRE
jgi:hypothetical protein